jgi:hypothetical protein
MCGGAGHLLVGEGGHHHPRLREDDTQRHQHCKVSPYSYRYIMSTTNYYKGQIFWPSA